MRWEALFADLEAQLASAAAQEDEAPLAELVRAEVAQVALVDRVRAARGGELRLRLRDGAQEVGELLDAGPDWLLLHGRGLRAVVPSAAVATVAGLTRAVAPPAGVVERRLGLASALRALARRRAPVRLHLLGSGGGGGAEGGAPGALAGTIDRVGADHLDLAVHPPDEPRRAGAVREVLVVPLAAVAVVREAAPSPRGAP